MFGISLETGEEKWMWGSIFGSAGVIVITTMIAARRMCKKCRRDKNTKCVIQSLYSQDDNGTVPYLGNHSGGELMPVPQTARPIVPPTSLPVVPPATSPTAPPYDDQL